MGSLSIVADGGSTGRSPTCSVVIVNRISVPLVGSMSSAVVFRYSNALAQVAAARDALIGTKSDRKQAVAWANWFFKGTGCEPDTSVLPQVRLGGLSRRPRRVRRLGQVGVRFTAGGIGRLLVGNLSDRVDRERAMSVSFLLCGGGVFGGAVTGWLVTLTSWPSRSSSAACWRLAPGSPRWHCDRRPSEL